MAFDPAVLPHPNAMEFTAIWDTAATNSVVTSAVVAACGLVPTGMTQVMGENSLSIEATYLVGVRFPNNVVIPAVEVTSAVLGIGCDVLIGMDVITQGDFAVMNRGGNTIFSFSGPALFETESNQDSLRGRIETMRR
jgi:hypothetical protein